MYAGKPIIGIAGGIGSGKSWIADLFGELSCLVIHADEQIRAAYNDEAVKHQLRQWWGDGVFKSDGAVSRKAVAQKVFADPEQRVRLEKLLHPMVIREREKTMEQIKNNAQVPAIVWDIPLLFETDQQGRCDAVVFVQAPWDLRLTRVRQARGWDESELRRRENLQWPLDKKREISQYVIDNTADADYARTQVSDVLSRILAKRS